MPLFPPPGSLSGNADLENVTATTITEAGLRVATQADVDGFAVTKAGVGAGDDPADNEDDWDTLVAAMSDTDAGRVWFATSETAYGVGSASDAAGYRLSGKDNFMMEGEGPFTRIENDADNNGTPVVLHDISGLIFRNFEINGNKATQSAGTHGLSLTDVTRAIVEKVYIRDAKSYGFASQNGTNTGLILSQMFIDGSGNDGIDFKNLDDAHSGQLFGQIVVRNFGTNGDGQKAGIDIRGEGSLGSQLTVLDWGSGASDIGLRIRPGALLDSSGYGGHDCHFGQVFIKPATKGTTRGTSMEADRGTITGLGVINADIGAYFVTGSHNGIGMSAMHECDIGYRVQDGSDYITLIGPRATDCDTLGIDIIGDYAQVIGGVGTGSGTQDLQISASSTDTVVIGGHYDSISDNGVNTTILGVPGVINKLQTTGGLEIYDDGTKVLDADDDAARFRDGTDSVPGISFIGDTDTGLFRPGGNAIGVVAGGTEIMRMNSARVAMPDGTATFPGMAFLSDTNTGAARTAADTMALVAGGTTGLVVGPGGTLFAPNLPTSDPAVADQLWNDSGTLKVSAG